MRKPFIILISVIAISTGGVAAYLARDWIASPTTRFRTVVVAAAPLGFGTTLTTENVTEVWWPAHKVPEGVFASKDELFKTGRRVALTPMQRNELVINTKITGPGQRPSLSALLDEGKRAVTVRVDDVRGGAGFVLPGDWVDVMLIRSVVGAHGAPENVSDVLLQHVKVLAVDQLANEQRETPTVARAVTMEVDTNQAQKILLATNVGKLSLILWQAGENNPVAAQRVTERDLSRMEPVATPAPVATMLTRTVPDSLLPCSTPMADDKPLPLDWPCWRVP